nr:FtsW/RodA/SpoVE family cell cycle protein [Lacrimispora celerecrescens]
MLFVATGKWLYLLAGAGGGTLASMLAYQLFGHVRTRVSAWLNPWADIAGKGYQITQSLFAIGTGGWFGMGLYRGMPRRIPVVEKDFIFSAISEELGGIFALCVLLICLGCFLQFMMIASRMQAVFYKLIAFGLGTIYIIQVFLTVGGVTKFIPSTGVTLPLVSYGGSSILSTFIIFGIIQGLYILKRNEEEEEKYEG